MVGPTGQPSEILGKRQLWWDVRGVLAKEPKPIFQQPNLSRTTQNPNPQANCNLHYFFNCTTRSTSILLLPVQLYYRYLFNCTAC